MFTHMIQMKYNVNPVYYGTLEYSDSDLNRVRYTMRYLRVPTANHAIRDIRKLYNTNTKINILSLKHVYTASAHK